MELMAKDLAVIIIAPDGAEFRLEIPKLKIETEILEKFDDPHIVVDNTHEAAPLQPRYFLTMTGECFRSEEGLVYQLVEVTHEHADDANVGT